MEQWCLCRTVFCFVNVLRSICCYLSLLLFATPLPPPCLKPLLYVTNTLHLFILGKGTDVNFDSVVFTTGKAQFIFCEGIRVMTTRSCDLTIYSVFLFLRSRAEAEELSRRLVTQKFVSPFFFCAV